MIQMTLTTRRALVVMAIAALLAAPVAAQRPQRIVSLIPAVTEILFAIGAGPQVVAVSSFDDYPPEAKKLPRVGALLDPDLERILSLRPDFVVLYGSQQDLAQQLARSHIGVYTYRHAGLADVTQTIREIGTRAGHEAEAQALASGIDASLDRIRQRVAGRPRPRTLLVFAHEIGALRGIYASGGVGFLADMLDVAGGTNVFADVQRESVQATTELILARRPDVILEVRGDANEAGPLETEAAVWKALPSVPAVRNGRIHFIVDERIVRPGPRVAEGAELLARALHPEAFGRQDQAANSTGTGLGINPFSNASVISRSRPRRPRSP
jgi:iron complex transport system substrate-binding protein